MYFKNIDIQGFRGIKKLKIDDLQNINLFVGQNNSCKTSILEAIFLLLGVSNPELIIKINNFRDLIITEEDDFRFIFNDLNYKNQLMISATQGKNALRELVIEPQLKKQKSISQSSYELNEESQTEMMNLGTSPLDESITELLLKFKIKEFQTAAKNHKAKLLIEKNKLTFVQPENYREKIRGVYVTPKIGLVANLEKELEDIIVNKRQQEIIEILNLVDQTITNISFGRNRMIYMDIGIKKLVPINLLGDGIRRLLGLVLSIYNAKNGIVLIDEIENGLHYSILKDVWKVVFEAAKKFKVQVFVTTHNIETLKYLKEAAKKAGTSTQRSIRSYTIRKLSDLSLKAYKYDFEKFDISIEQGVEIR